VLKLDLALNVKISFLCENPEAVCAANEMCAVSSATLPVKSVVKQQIGYLCVFRLLLLLLLLHIYQVKAGM